MSSASIKPGSATTDNVSAADQAKINKFARLHTRLEELKARQRREQTEVQNWTDASDDLLLVDDGLPIPVRVGEIFIDYDSADQVNDIIDDEKAKLQESLDGIASQKADIERQLAVLKTDLKAKFGSSINLEADDS